MFAQQSKKGIRLLALIHFVIFLCFAHFSYALPRQDISKESFEVTMFVPFEVQRGVTVRGQWPNHTILNSSNGEILVLTNDDWENELIKFSSKGDIVLRNTLTKTKIYHWQFLGNALYALGIDYGQRRGFLGRLDPRTLNILDKVSIPEGFYNYFLLDNDQIILSMVIPYPYLFNDKPILAKYALGKGISSFDEIFKEIDVLYIHNIFIKDDSIIIAKPFTGTFQIRNKFGIVSKEIVLTEALKNTMKSGKRLPAVTYNEQFDSYILALDQEIVFAQINPANNTLDYVKKFGVGGTKPGRFKEMAAISCDTQGQIYTLSRGERSYNEWILQRISPTSIFGGTQLASIKEPEGYLGDLDGIPIDNEFSKMLNLPVESGLYLTKIPPNLTFLRLGSKQITIRNVNYRIGSDILLEIDDKPIKSKNDVGEAVKGKKAEDPVKVKYFSASTNAFKEEWTKIINRPTQK